MNVKVTKDDLADVLKSIHGLVSKEVLIGIPESADARKQREADGSPLGNAAIGYIQETGSPANNLPARPHLVPGVEEALPACIKYLKAGATKALSGQLNAGDQAMTKAGLTAASSVRNKINSNIQPALAPATIAARKRRGITRTNTLVDSGGYRNSITYVIAKKK